MIELDYNNPYEVRMAGLAALSKSLGPVGMIKFMQQFEENHGDYTAEKYNQPDEPIDEIIAKLKKYREQA
ncbi:MAG: hypothetical protein IJT21_02230 [Synergistaceae bacterium]|nr:hypothetical protein [Synergistaceae bacterium]